MDFVEILINLLNLDDKSNLFKIHFEKFTDKYEYKGERIKSFILFTILVLFSLALIIFVLFLLYTILIKLKS
jgi:hypothetical protein